MQHASVLKTFSRCIHQTLRSDRSGLTLCEMAGDVEERYTGTALLFFCVGKRPFMYTKMYFWVSLYSIGSVKGIDPCA